MAGARATGLDSEFDARASIKVECVLVKYVDIADIYIVFCQLRETLALVEKNTGRAGSKEWGAFRTNK